MQVNGVGAAITSVDHITAMSPPTDTRGKHRILAERKRLEQESRFLEEELEELKKTEKVSAVLQEYVYEINSCHKTKPLFIRLLLKVDSRPDPLLPVTSGPANASWDRWFEGPQDLHGCRCWIM
ncbi:guanine nucleotide-binding protein subunit gamma 1-like isoform X1 [Typha latifolia]|uniref:guanine nucleotide-binding protein subunit gamma 1-like isoform X1 n=1 Tax=Typha latifolia TaxID=4733 RepID=UPI003C2D1A15